MSRAYIPISVRQKVAKEAQYRCGYCLSPQALSGLALTIDHIIPISLGGTNDPENLWLACRSCNEAKGNRTVGVDPQTGNSAPLFNPRTQQWHHHFQWSEAGTHIIGVSAVGHATVQALNLNHDLIIKTRSRWVAVGWHPPSIKLD